jgi:hypothetical protein
MNINPKSSTSLRGRKPVAIPSFFCPARIAHPAKSTGLPRRCAPRNDVEKVQLFYIKGLFSVKAEGI